MRAPGRSIRPFALAVALAALSGGAAPPASGHAVLITEFPVPNIGYGRPPETVRLRFSEPLRVPPSTIRVFDGGGRDVAGPVRRVPTDPQSMEARLGDLPRGPYRVEWKSVSILDGHTIRGSYSFGVGEPPRGAESESESGPLTGPGAPGIAFRVVQDAGLLFLAGLAAMALVSRRRVPRFAAHAAGVAPWVALVAAAGSVATVLAEGVAAAGWSASGLAAFLSGSWAGWARAALLALALAAIPAALARRPLLLLVWAVGALAAIGVSGHAGATPHPARFMAADAAHLAFAGVWIGGAAALAIGWRRLRLERGEIAALLARASPLAIISALLVAGTGSVNAFGQLTGISDLWDTSYGAIVAGKVAALLAAAALGARHSFVLRRRLAAAPDPAQAARGIRGALLGERWAGLGAVLLAAILVAFPDPPAQEARAERQATTVPAVFAVGGEDFVTVAGRDGPLLVALVISPPEPGATRVAVQLSHSAGASTDGWAVALEATGPGGRSVRTTLAPCGPGCFGARARFEARGAWSLRVRARDSAVSFRLALPVPDGSVVLRRARSAYDRLRSLRVDETFESGLGFRQTAEYLLQAPNRVRIRTSAGREEVTVGRRSFSRDRPGEPWRESGSFISRFPLRFPWLDAGTPRLLPDGVVDGRAVWTLALFDDGIWFEVQVDKRTSRPLREKMMAVGHFMERVYRDFDGRIDIRAPMRTRS